MGELPITNNLSVKCIVIVCKLINVREYEWCMEFVSETYRLAIRLEHILVNILKIKLDHSQC